MLGQIPGDVAMPLGNSSLCLPPPPSTLVAHCSKGKAQHLPRFQAFHIIQRNKCPASILAEYGPGACEEGPCQALDTGHKSLVIMSACLGTSSLSSPEALCLARLLEALGQHSPQAGASVAEAGSCQCMCVPQVGKLRERLQEAKLEREQEQRRHTAFLSELRAKLHEEKTRELQALREALIRQHEAEAARAAKIKEGELQRLQATLAGLRDGAADKVKTALLAEARDEARRAFDGERLRLQQEILELKAARRQAEEALGHCMQADKAKAADLRAAYQAHQDEVHRIKRECERDIRRLVCTVRPHQPTRDLQAPAILLPRAHGSVCPLKCTLAPSPVCMHPCTCSWVHALVHVPSHPLLSTCLCAHTLVPSPDLSLHPCTLSSPKHMV